MSIRVERKSLISWLEQVQAGLSNNQASPDQSQCFVFSNGYVKTFNDQVYCRRKTNLPKEFRIAVRGAKLLEHLYALTENEITLDISGDSDSAKLVVRGKGKGKARINSDKEIKLDTGEVEMPETWTKMPDGLNEAIRMVKECCGRNKDQSEFMYVHIHPKWVEASDNLQTARFTIKTGFTKSHLIKHAAATEVSNIGMVKIAETDGWVHFRSADKLTISCRRYLEDYKDLTPMFKFDGVKVVLPKGLKAAADRCDTFTSEKEKEGKNLAKVELRKDELTIVGEGISGEYEKPFPVKYKGKPVRFMISPKILSKIVEEHNECVIEDEISPTNGRIKAEFGKYIYAATLAEIEERK